MLDRLGVRPSGPLVEKRTHRVSCEGPHGDAQARPLRDAAWRGAGPELHRSLQAPGNGGERGEQATRRHVVSGRRFRTPHGEPDAGRKDAWSSRDIFNMWWKQQGYASLRLHSRLKKARRHANITANRDLL